MAKGKKSIHDLQAQFERIRTLAEERGDNVRLMKAYNIAGRYVRNITKYQRQQREIAMASGRPIPHDVYGKESRVNSHSVKYNHNTRLGLNYK